METQVKTTASESPWLNELTKPEVQEALSALIQKLPQITATIEKAEQGINLASSFINDSNSINSIAEGLNGISSVAIKKENIDSLVTIVEKLPRIAQTVEMLDRMTPFIETFANVKFLESAIETGQVIAAPVTDRIQNAVSIAKEAKERAEQNTATISIFGMLKILKDPTVQEGFKFLQALLEVNAERKATR